MPWNPYKIQIYNSPTSKSTTNQKHVASNAAPAIKCDWQNM